MNIAKAVKGYIERHPSMKDCLKAGLLNYSSLSRRIISDLELRQKDFDAVLVACRREHGRMRASRSTERDIIEIFRNGKLEVRNRICVAVIEKLAAFESLIKLETEIKKRSEPVHVVESANAVVMITSDEFSENIKKIFGRHLVSMRKDLVEVTIRSPKEIETTPGVVSTLSSILFENGVNIVEIASCWTDTIVVIDEKDTAKVLEILKF